MTPWTEYASIVALGIGANSENLPVGLGYGMQGRKIGLASNLFIAAVTTGATLVPLAIGERLRGYMPERWPDIIGGRSSSFWGSSTSGLIVAGSPRFTSNQSPFAPRRLA